MDTDRQLMRQRFWFLVVLSSLLIVVFALYLPERFYWQATTGMGHTMPMDGTAMPQSTTHAHGAYAFHEEKDVTSGIAVNFSLATTSLTSNEPATLRFFVNEKPQGTPIVASSLELEHEKLMHVIGVRSDLSEFFHIHPNPTSSPGVLLVDHTFSKPGEYKIWSEVKKGGTIHGFGHTPVTVSGSGPVEEKKVSFGRNIIVDQYQVALAVDDVVAKGYETDLSFDVHSFTGEEIVVENYLGAQMHLAIISEDRSVFLHTHPEDGSHNHASLRLIPVAHAHGGVDDGHMSDAPDEMVNFHVAFPKAGLYKLFAQFRPVGVNLPPDEALRAEFWVKVEDAKPSIISQWWGLLLVSLIAILILSFIVKKAITVKPVEPPKQST